MKISNEVADVLSNSLIEEKRLFLPNYQYYNYILEVIDLIDELVAKVNPEKFDFQAADPLLSDELKKKIYDFAYPKLKDANVDADKHRRSTNIKNIRKETAELLEIRLSATVRKDEPVDAHRLALGVVALAGINARLRGDSAVPG